MTEAEAQRLVTTLAAAFPSALAKLTEQQQRDTAAVYRRMLLDLPYPLANAAVERAIATSRFLPSVAEIRAAAGELAGGDRQPALAALGAVRSMASWRSRSELEALDPTVRACLESLGWIAWTDVFRGGEVVRCWRVQLGDCEAADRARWCEIYGQLEQRDRDRVITGALPAAQRLRALQAAEREQQQLAGAVAGVLRLVDGGAA